MIGNFLFPSVPGLYFSTEIKLFAKLDIAADVTIGQSNETVYTVGICFIRGDFERTQIHTAVAGM